jgi:soluble lytic murein transglycosylase-like protein
MIISRESGGNPNAANPTSSARGLLQLMSGWYAGDYYNFPDFDPLNPRLNLYYGHKGYLVSGWQPWSVN